MERYPGWRNSTLTLKRVQNGFGPSAKVQATAGYAPLIRLRHLFPTGAGRRRVNLLFGHTKLRIYSPSPPPQWGRRCRRRMRAAPVLSVLRNLDSTPHLEATDDPRYRGRRLHRISRRPRTARARPGGRGDRQPQRVLRREAQARTAGAARAFAAISLRARRRGRPRGDGSDFRGAATVEGHPPGGAGGSALLARESPRLRREQRHRLSQHPGGLPAESGGAPGLCVVELRVRDEREPALLGARKRRSPCLPLRGHEEGERADGSRLSIAVRDSGHWAPVLHRLWPDRKST